MSGLESPSIALIGAGAMGGALVRGWIEAVRKGGGLTLTVVEPNFDPDLESELDAVGAVLNPPNPGPADVLVLAVKLARSHLSPIIGVLTMIGAFTLANSTIDMWVALAFGVIGYVFRLQGKLKAG